MEKENRQHYIIFDIDSSSIGTLVFEKSLDEKTKKDVYHEVFTLRKNIATGQNVDFEIFFSRTLKVFEYVAERAHKYSGNSIAQVYINIAAPWSSSQKRVIHYEREREFNFTKELADSIIEKELEESLHHTHDFKDHKGLALIERRTVDTFANGYPTKKPFGKKLKDVDIHSLVSVMSEKTKDALSHVIERNFHIEPVYFSNVFMTYQSLINLFPQENNITCIDVSGEVSEISIIVSDHLKRIGTIPVGEHHIVRKLSQLLKIPYTKAESIIKMYQSNTLEEKYKKDIESAMKESFLYWFKHFYDFLGEVSKEYLIPDTLCLLSPEYIHNWLSEWILKTEELGEHMHAQKNISILDLKMLWRTAQKKELQNITDDNLALCLDFVEKTFLGEEIK